MNTQSIYRFFIYENHEKAVADLTMSGFLDKDGKCVNQGDAVRYVGFKDVIDEDGNVIEKGTEYMVNLVCKDTTITFNSVGLVPNTPKEIFSGYVSPYTEEVVSPKPEL